MKTLAVSLALVAAPLSLAACVTQPERGPAIIVNAHGPLSERVQAQVGVVDAKLAAVEQLCEGDDGRLQDRCLAPLHELKRKRAYYRQRAYALTKTATSDSLDDVTAWKALEIEVEMLTVEVDELADDLKHAG